MLVPKTLKKRFEDIASNTPDTPDKPELQLFDDHYVFIYDARKWGYNLGHTLESQQLCSTFVRTYDRDFEMYKACNVRGPQAVAMKGLSKTQPGLAHISGELYLVKTEMIYRLDSLYMNGTAYDRKKVKVYLPTEKDEKKKILEAWMYIGNDDYWYSRIWAFEHDEIIDIEYPTNWGKPDAVQFYAFTLNDQGKLITEYDKLLRRKGKL